MPIHSLACITLSSILAILCKEGQHATGIFLGANLYFNWNKKYFRNDYYVKMK